MNEENLALAQCSEVNKASVTIILVQPRHDAASLIAPTKILTHSCYSEQSSQKRQLIPSSNHHYCISEYIVNIYMYLDVKFNTYLLNVFITLSFCFLTLTLHLVLVKIRNHLLSLSI